MTDIQQLADYWFNRLKSSWEVTGDDPPERLTLGTFDDAAMLAAWHRDLTLDSHRALVAALTMRLAAIGIEVRHYPVTLKAYERWRGKRADTPENRARFIGEEGMARPWRLGIKLGMAEKSQRGAPHGGALGWCAFDTDSGWRSTASGTMRQDP